MILYDSGASTSANVVSSNGYGALITRPIEAAPTDATQLNASYTYSNADEVVATTTTVTMTIGSDTYTRTMTYNAAGDLLSISAWSAT